MHLHALALALMLQAPTAPPAPQDADTPKDPPAATETAADEGQIRTLLRPVGPIGRRRGSMVGYIEDATMGSQVRIRFDAGWHNRAPDRAEFFYAKCGCYRDLPASTGIKDPDAPGPGPGIVADLKFQQAYLRAELGGSHGSIFAEVPLRWVKPQAFAPDSGSFADQSGLADIRGGLKLGLMNTGATLVTVQLQGYFPTGDAKKGLGTDHFSVEPVLIVDQRIGDRGGLAAQFGDWHPFGGSKGIPPTSSEKFTGDIVFYGVGPSFDVYKSDQVTFTPIVELVGWHITKGFQTPPADIGGTNIVNLKFGARTTFAGDLSSLYVGWGRRLSTAGWYDDIFRVEFRRLF